MARVLPKAPVGSSRSLFAVGAAVVALYLFVLRPLSGVPDALLLGFAGVVFAVLLDIPVSPLAKRIPRPVAVVVVLLALAGLLLLAARLAVPAVWGQLGVLAAQLPSGVGRLLQLVHRLPGLERFQPVQLDLPRLVGSAFGHVVPFVSGAFAALASLGVAGTIGAFLCADPRADLGLIELLAREEHRDRAHRIIEESAKLLRRWMTGSLVTMAVVGALTAFGLLLVGVRSWLALGLLAFAGALVPYLGSIVTGAVILAAGLADSPKRALLALAVYAVVQALLGTVIAPLANRWAIRTSPTVLLMFQLIMAASFGVLGVLLAQPLLAVLTVVLENLHGESSEPNSPTTAA